MDASFARNRCRKAELIPDHSADEIVGLKISEISCRPESSCFGVEDAEAEALPSADGELVGISPSEVLEGFAAVVWGVLSRKANPSLYWQAEGLKR